MSPPILGILSSVIQYQGLAHTLYLNVLVLLLSMPGELEPLCVSSLPLLCCI